MRSEYAANLAMSESRSGLGRLVPHRWALIAPAVVRAARHWLPQDAADIRLERTLIAHGLMKSHNAIECIEAYENMLAVTFETGHRLEIPTD